MPQAMINNIRNLIDRAERLRQQGLIQQAEICENHAWRLQKKYDVVLNEAEGAEAFSLHLGTAKRIGQHLEAVSSHVAAMAQIVR